MGALLLSLTQSKANLTTITLLPIPLAQQPHFLIEMEAQGCRTYPGPMSELNSGLVFELKVLSLQHSVTLQPPR